MRVNVEFTGQVRTAAGRDLAAIDLAAGGSLADLVAQIVATGPPALRTHLLTGAGRLQPTLVIVINGKAVAGGQQRETVELADGSTVMFLPPVAGG